jgi:PadR family transcriptional regulator, regulatory protein PadR
MIAGKRPTRRARFRPAFAVALLSSVSNSYTRETSVATRDKTDLLRGTLDLLILKTLTLEPLHGVAIADRIAQVTSGTFRVQAGSLFPALHRLEASDLITGEWTTTPDGRRIKSYALTAAGKRQLNAETKQWERIVTAMSQVLQLT